MARTKGLLLGVLADAYQARDTVALQVFRDDAAPVLVDPTRTETAMTLRDIRIFTGNANPVLVQEICSYLDVPMGRARVGRFSDSEVNIEIDESVRGLHAFVIQSTCTPVNDHLMELLVFIDMHLKQTGFSPSFDDMKDALYLRSKSGIHRLVTALEERGYIARRPHRARALEILKLPENLEQKKAAATGGEVKEITGHNVVRAEFPTMSPPIRPANDVAAIQLPFYGKIAAGVPIEALRDNSTTVDVPAGLLGNGEHYALEVAGDSMVDAGILDGDTVLIRRGDWGENGQIVVALVDEQEVTLKRLRRRGDAIALEPCNTTMRTQIFSSERVKVQGRLVGLMRKY